MTLPIPGAAQATVLTSLLLSTIATPARGQVAESTRRTAAGTRTDSPPTIDGRLEDAAWTAAPAVTGFIQHEPFEGRPASERTEVRVLYDDEALYVGAWLFDSNPDGIVVGESRRDASLEDTDAILIVLDTYLDRQNAFVFGTSPAAVEYDGQVTREGGGGGPGRNRQQSGSGGGFNLNWDGSWRVQTSRDERGWYAEFRIPFSTLRYSGGTEQVWGLNLARHIRRRNEQVFWAPIPREFDLYRVSLAGTLAGLEVPASRVFHVTPYALASAHRDYSNAAEFEYPFEFGADAKIGVTSSLTLDLTYNTDFAQVEVDEQQVNLTRFSLFFPEKRPFFLENAGTFAVGSPQAVELFFSRRIGIGSNGQPVPILGGARLTGRVAGYTVGLLNIQTDEALGGAIPANNYTVARVLRELPGRSRVGAIFVNRFAPGEDGDYNRTYGIDGRLGIGEAITFDTYVAATQTPGRDGREHAYSLTGGYSTSDWSLGLEYSEVGDAFNPEVGFLARSAYRYYQARVMRYIRLPDVPWLRELRPHASYQGYFDPTGFRESGHVHLDSHIEFSNGAFFSPAFNFAWEGLKEPFQIEPGVFVPPGLYEGWAAEWRLNSDESAPLALNGGINYGSFLSGSRRGVFATVTARRGATFIAALRTSYDDIDLPQGRFDATLVSLRLGYSFTPRIFLQSLVQYSSQAELWSGNLRFGWLNTAGTGLFVVYNEAQGRGITAFDGSWEPRDRRFVVKFTRRFHPFQ